MTDTNLYLLYTYSQHTPFKHAEGKVNFLNSSDIKQSCLTYSRSSEADYELNWLFSQQMQKVFFISSSKSATG